MSTITGSFVGEAGLVEDRSHVDISNWDAGDNHTTSPTTFEIPGRYKNTGNVEQTVTVGIANLSANVSAVDIDMGDGTNVAVLQPGEESAKPVVTVTGDVPAQPGPGEPAVTEGFSFDLDPVWT